MWTAPELIVATAALVDVDADRPGRASPRGRRPMPREASSAAVGNPM